MEYRKFQITLVSASDLPDVRNIGLMKVYAKVSLNGESKTKKKTPTDMEGLTNPKWNFPIEYTISESSVEKQGMNIGIKLYCERTFGDKFIGEVKISVKSLFDQGLKAEKILSYPVAGTSNGRLNILYDFGDKFLGRKPSSSWKKGMLGVGFLVLLGGAMLLLGDDDDKSEENDDFDYRDRNFDFDGEDYCEVHRTVDGDVFYDAKP